MRKIISIIIICILLATYTFAGAPIYYRTPLDAETTNEVVSPKANPSTPMITPTDFVPNQYDMDKELLSYYEQQLMIYPSLANYHEENYLYSNGEHGVSYYNGTLTYVIQDFDRDGIREMAIFRIVTNSVDEYSNKDIIMDIIRLVDGKAILSDTVVICSEQYIGEEIECDISIKYVNEMWRIYLNYFEKKVRENQYESRFRAYEYTGNLNLISEINLSANEDNYYGETFEFQDQIIDAGINIQDDTNIYNRAFLNDDLKVLPIFTIKRVNEKVKDAYVEDFFEQYGSELENGDFRRLRYGYTQFIDRAHVI